MTHDGTRPHLPSSHLPLLQPSIVSTFTLRPCPGLWQVPLLHDHSPLAHLLQHGEVTPPHPGKHSAATTHTPPPLTGSTTWCSTMSSTPGTRRLQRCCRRRASRLSPAAPHRRQPRSGSRAREWTSTTGLIPALLVLPRPQRPPRAEGQSVIHRSALRSRQRRRAGSRPRARAPRLRKTP